MSETNNFTCAELELFFNVLLFFIVSLLCIVLFLLGTAKMPFIGERAK